MAEPAGRTIGDLVASRSETGESRHPIELLQLESCLLETGPIVAWIHGPPGTGKTALLDEFGARAETSGAAVIDLPFPVSEMTGEIIVRGVGTADSDDDFNWNASTINWVPDPFVDPTTRADCPGGIMIGAVGYSGAVVTELFKAPGAWGPDWTNSANERLIAPPGFLSVDVTQFRLTLADHSKAIAAEDMFISWDLWLREALP